MIVLPLVLLLSVLRISYAEENVNEIERYIITCRSTDFTCFRRQYQYLRDLAVLGSRELAVPEYRTYMFQYADTYTCVKMTGVEASQLAEISFDGFNKLLSLRVTMPIVIEQVPATQTMACEQPEIAFTPRGPHEGPYSKFTCNATAIFQFPLRLYKENRQMFTAIEEEELEVVLDVPDLSSYNKNSRVETNIYRNSEWAYEMVQHVSVPDHVMVPFMQRLKTIYTRLPLHRFILLYPTERYNELLFKYSDDISNQVKHVLS